MNKFIWFGLFIGGTIGGYVPALWGAGYFSISGIIFSAIGGAIGVWAGFKADQFFRGEI